MKNGKSVLIVGGGLQAISSANSLHKSGFRTGLWAPDGDYAHKSSHLDFRGDGHYDEDLSPLISFILANRVDVVIPMSDKYALQLSRNRDLIERRTNCKVGAPEIGVLELAADKLRLMDFCAANGFPHPVTVKGTDLSEKQISSLPFPMLVKPNHSVGARGIVKVAEPTRLADVVCSVEAKFGPCHCQEFIDGSRPYFNVMVYRDSSGRCVNYAVLEIVRYYPLQGGSSSMCRSVDDQRLASLCMNVLDKMNYVGFADFDVLMTADGEPRIIEINPRVPASLRGAAVSGVNFPALIAADALGMELPKCTYTPGKTLRYLGLDLMWFLSSQQRFKTRPGWFRFFGRDIYYQEGGREDWKAMFASLISNFNKLEFRGGRLRKKSN